MSNWTVINHYFDLLETIIKSLSLDDKPSQIFNCDETGFTGKEKCHEKVLSRKGTHSYQQAVLCNNHITVNVCVAADGRVLPPFVIFEGGLPHRNFKDGVSKSWLYGSSETGYMDGDLFYRWYEEIFLQHCGSRRPVLLLMDNHDSHITIKLIETARANNIHLLGLPPHTTHVLQPLDVGVFGPLKDKVRTLAGSLIQISANASIGKAKFPALLSTAIDTVCSPALVKSSFRKCGISPLDGNAIDKSQIMPAEDKVTNTDDGSMKASEDTCTVLCENCGTEMLIEKSTITLQNPLVTKGIIPPSLATVLLPPQTKKKKTTSSKIVTKARVITDTSDDILKQLKDREQANKEQEEAKEARKIERIKKREEKEREEEEKQLRKEEKKIREEKKKEEEKKKRKKNAMKRKAQRRKDGTDNNCLVCRSVDPPEFDSSSDNDNLLVWYQCDQCEG